jgi:hypothetical protein
MPGPEELYVIAYQVELLVGSITSVLMDAGGTFVTVTPPDGIT